MQRIRYGLSGHARWCRCRWFGKGYVCKGAPTICSLVVYFLYVSLTWWVLTRPTTSPRSASVRKVSIHTTVVRHVYPTYPRYGFAPPIITNHSALATRMSSTWVFPTIQSISVTLLNGTGELGRLKRIESRSMTIRVNVRPDAHTRCTTCYARQASIG